MVKSRVKVLWLVILFSAINLKAQTKDNPWVLNSGIGISEYSGDLGFGFFKFRMLADKGSNNRPGIGYIGLTKYVNNHFNIGINYLHGEWGYKNFETQKSFYTVTQNINALVFWKFLDNDGSKLIPFFVSGLGFRHLGYSKVNELVIPLGIGARYMLSERFGINAQTNYLQAFSDKGDFVDNGNMDVAWQTSIGISYNLTNRKDTDKDGVYDKYDKCPNTPLRAAINKDGCILDADNDSIADNFDDCPYDAGLAKFGGCPDRDNDGIIDSDDKCPDIAGILKFNGCPDTDGDGIQDSEDKCKDVKGIAKFNGCPDTDGDGIQDSEDKCPTVAGLEMFGGCPDTDNDGIEDAKDKCPTVPGYATNFGCPELKVEEKKVLAEALAGVMFESSSTKIRTVSYPKLDNVVKVLANNPNYKLLIEGHTDNDGNSSVNLQLSKDRAISVKDYLISKGIAANRLTTNGFGDANPIADNKTKAGRLKNRRVEFKITQ